MNSPRWQKITTRDECNLTVAVPSTENWKRRFGLSLVSASIHFLATAIPGFGRKDIQIRFKQGSILSNMRQDLVQDAIDGGASHIAFVDADMQFDPRTFTQMVSHRLPVVALNCPIKRLPSLPTAYRRPPSGSATGMRVVDVMVPTTAESKGLEEVWRVGTGIMLIDLEVFEHIQKPWFPMVYHEELGKYQGEDWGFVELCEKAGIPIFIDHDLSKEVGHVGELMYTHAHVQPFPKGE